MVGWCSELIEGLGLSIFARDVTGNITSAQVADRILDKLELLASTRHHWCIVDLIGVSHEWSSFETRVLRLASGCTGIRVTDTDVQVGCEVVMIGISYDVVQVLMMMRLNHELPDDEAWLTHDLIDMIKANHTIMQVKTIHQVLWVILSLLLTTSISIPISTKHEPPLLDVSDLASPFHFIQVGTNESW